MSALVGLLKVKNTKIAKFSEFPAYKLTTSTNPFNGFPPFCRPQAFGVKCSKNIY